MNLAYNVSGSSGDFTVSAQKNGKAIFMGSSVRKVSNLSCIAIVLADTNTLTLTGHWEVSNDNSTWQTATVENNAANVALATGTAGADTAVTTVVTAPEAVYGWRYARYCVVPGVTTAASIDTWNLAYSYRQLSAGEG